MRRKTANRVKYDNHKEEWTKALNDPVRKKIAETWFDKSTLDAWRHLRMRAPLKPLIESDLEASWLTVGDGRFGTDANFLISSGAKKVHASDISYKLLKISNEKGFINDYSSQNAENIAFDDNSFDYIYCKDSLHHFPRPYIALDEMFRVARRAVILTEPRDHLIDTAPLSRVMLIIKKILRPKSRTRHGFEPVGNYVYAISERELEKFLLGMHYTLIAFHGCNDYYIEGVEHVRLDGTSREEKRLRRKTLMMIKLQDILTKLRLTKANYVSAILFKDTPSAQCLSGLRESGWDIRDLPRNPFLSNESE